MPYMAGEKYIIATAENSIQIGIRNMINPEGYEYLSNCNDAISLMRLIRSYHPDFVIVDTNMKLRELRNTIETIDEEMLCACIIIGEYKDLEIVNLLEKSKVLSHLTFKYFNWHHFYEPIFIRLITNEYTSIAGLPRSFISLFHYCFIHTSSSITFQI